MTSNYEYKSNGYLVRNLPKTSILAEIKQIIATYDKELCRYTDTEGYHSRLLECQSKINRLKPQEAFVAELQQTVIELLGSKFIGVSSTVYCRGVRPDKEKTIMVEYLPMHREIFYTDMEYANHQINIHIPLHNYTHQTCMYFHPFSHLVKDQELELTKYESEQSGVSRYSDGHSLGLPYNPKVVDNLENLERAIPCPVSIGQVFIFDSRLLHGGGKNTSDSIRYSLDFAVLPYEYLSKQKGFHHASYKSGSHFYQFNAC
jgi:hypothetical protein